MTVEHIEDWHFYDGSFEGLCFVDGFLCWFACKTDPSLDSERRYDVWRLDAEAVRVMTSLLSEASPAEPCLTEHLAGHEPLTEHLAGHEPLTEHLAGHEPLTEISESDFDRVVEKP